MTKGVRKILVTVVFVVCVAVLYSFHQHLHGQVLQSISDISAIDTAIKPVSSDNEKTPVTKQPSGKLHTYSQKNHEQVAATKSVLTASSNRPSASTNVLNKPAIRERIQARNNVNNGQRTSVPPHDTKQKTRYYQVPRVHRTGGDRQGNYNMWDDPHISGLDFWNVLNRSHVEDHLVRPRVGDYLCRDVLCSELLSQKDLNRVDKCIHKLKSKRVAVVKEIGPSLVPVCHFINGTSRASRVVLVSFPGSGNTWVRGLLEKATGVCTGSVYCDVTIWMSGSVGEGINSGSVLVVKTHNAEKDWVKQSCSNPDSYTAAILLIRNPYDAIISYYKWEMHWLDPEKSDPHFNPHIMDVEHSMFGAHPKWQSYVDAKRKMWHHAIRNVILGDQCGRPILVVKYEDIKSNKIGEVFRMLDFLGVNYSPTDVMQRLTDDATSFHRQHTSLDFDPYTSEQRKSLQKEVEDVVTELEGNTLAVEKYLLSIV